MHTPYFPASFVYRFPVEPSSSPVARGVTIPERRDAGVDEETIKRLTHDNPFDAYAR